MARLGSILGGILAELARARVIADELTRDLVRQYEVDPVLSSMTVPRVSVNEAQLTLRFSVEDLQESPVPAFDVDDAGREWEVKASRLVFGRVAATTEFSESERRFMLDVLTAPPPSRADLRLASEGKPDAAVRSVVTSSLAKWQTIPKDIQRRLGGKAAFGRHLQSAVAVELKAFLDQRNAMATVRAALASRLDVEIRRKELPEDPAKLQEIRLTVRSEDLDALLSVKEEA